MKPEAVIVVAKRTPVGRVGAALKDIPPEELVALLIRTILADTAINPAAIDDVILGNASGPGGNLARLSALSAGLPLEVPGVTVDRQCGSGLEAINLAAWLVQAGAGEIFLAGGVESASQAPWKIEKPASLYQQAPRIFTRARFAPEAIGDPDMGIAAENVAERYGITRAMQDRYALASHQKAVESQRSGRFAAEIVPVVITAPKRATITVTSDECPRAHTSLEQLTALPPIFKAGGSVTAGNACPINDGAALALVMARHRAEALGLTPRLRFVDAVAVGVDPNYLGIGPVPAVQRLLARNHLTIADIDLVEFNEAFAAQVLACLNELALPQSKVNVGGGALALGHPYGASGAILVARLCAEVPRMAARWSIATLGIGGGMGLATLFASV